MQFWISVLGKTASMAAVNPVRLSVQAMKMSSTPLEVYTIHRMVSSCHNNIVETMSIENFRTGFQLGVMMVREAVSENEAVLFEL